MKKNKLLVVNGKLEKLGGIFFRDKQTPKLKNPFVAKKVFWKSLLVLYHNW